MRWFISTSVNIDKALGVFNKFCCLKSLVTVIVSVLAVAVFSSLAMALKLEKEAVINSEEIANASVD